MSGPLDKLHVIVESGKSKQTVAALDPRWMEQVQFVSYQPPPKNLSDKGQYEAWLERLKFIEDDLHWLLQLPHDKFWCQAIFDETLHRCIDSYLRFAPRSYNILADFPDNARDRHNQVHRLVFMTCVRMSTYKESKECYITPSVFGEILYENFIFDIPKLLDICVLYGQGNGPLLTKMIENIFTKQPKYNEDLEQTIGTLSQVFDSVMGKCGIRFDSGSHSPQKLSDHSNMKQSLVTMSVTEYTDIVLYLSDIGMTLTSFLEVYPTACQAFHESDFLVRLPSFYEAVIPEALSALKLRDIETKEKLLLKQYLIQAKKCLLTVFQTIMAQCCIQPILEKREPVIDFVDDYLHIVSSVLAERRFLADYESLHSFQGDIEILSQAACGIDETRLQYIQDAVNSAFSTYGKRKSPKGAMKRGGRRSPDGSSGEMVGAVGGGNTSSVQQTATSLPADIYQVEDSDIVGACAPQVTGVELDSMVSSVKDLLPDLGEGFIEVCLEELNYDIERVINAVLEDRLPQSLQEVDRQIPRKKRAVTPPSLLHERKNIYDFDEFDVFHRDDIDKQKIRKGKLDKTENVSIGDQAELKDIKSAISKDYGVIHEVVIDDGTVTYTRDMYDDEYDDTYDVNNVGADDADSADELSTVRPFTTPRILGGQTRTYRHNDSESEESDEDANAAKRDNFVEDPAVLRQRAEERARYKAGRAKPSQAPKTHDVKGGPKGQGQSSEVLHNRKWKTQHKGDFRRAAADRKRKV
ncbi:activating signal cointegrator 1 complex subunit 2-like isoform X1 [Ruditapes philippinarum]|uniref:activating signal cointegrator 1 complex subunit 2-like isoform X1 n=2 Tax=Ruditapes philippinarum TaxID=129788 RepID=UPI00295AFA4D|nr:activating signal cointegrator 1 complex subunit 2-like isoform X1 [Ruditapes philippinarum]